MIPTIKVKLKKYGNMEVVINESDFDPERHEKLEKKQNKKFAVFVNKDGKFYIGEKGSKKPVDDKVYDTEADAKFILGIEEPK